MKSALVLGGGFAGCSSAYLLNRLGFAVTLLEGGPNPGGGCWTNLYAGHPYTFGPRVFFSRDEQVIEQLTHLCPMRQFYTKTWTFVADDGKLYNYPIQASDLPLMPDYKNISKELSDREGKQPSVDDFETYWIDAIGPSLYHKFVENYSKKMWGVESNKQLLANWEWVNRGTPIRDGDNRLYTDQFQGYPENAWGYNQYFERCLEGTTLKLNCRVKKFDPDRRTVHTDAGPLSADIIVNTVYIDSLFENVYGRLQFCGRQFIPIWLPIKEAFPEDVTWIHYSGTEEHTRITEFKKITNHSSGSTLLGIEIPCSRGRYYPVQTPPELARFEQYKKLFPNNFFSIGRLGKFKYQGIPDAIRDALDIAEQLK